MFDLKHRSDPRRRRPRSYLSHWPVMLRLVFILCLVLWLLWVFKSRMEAPAPAPARRPPPPDTITFSEPDATPL